MGVFWHHSVLARAKDRAIAGGNGREGKQRIPVCFVFHWRPGAAAVSGPAVCVFKVCGFPMYEKWCFVHTSLHFPHFHLPDDLPLFLMAPVFVSRPFPGRNGRVVDISFSKPSFPEPISSQTAFMNAKLLSAFAFTLGIAGPLCGQVRSPTQIIAANVVDSATISESVTTGTRLSINPGAQYLREIEDGMTYTFENMFSSDADGNSYRGGVIRTKNSGASVVTLSFTGDGTVVFRNNATMSTGNTGGAICNYADAVISFNNVVFDKNKTIQGANGQGGGIYMRGGTLSIINSGTFSENYAQAQGGAIWIEATVRASINNTLFISNSAGTSGGAIWAGNNNSPAVMDLTDVTFTDNYAVLLGGAMHLRETGTVRLLATRDITHSGNATGSGTGGFAHMLTAGGYLGLSANAGATMTVGSASDVSKDNISSGIATVRVEVNAGGEQGTIILNADNSTYTGTVNVLGGKLLLGNSDAMLGGLINVDADATFGGQGAVAVKTGVNKNVRMDAGSVLQIGLDNTSGQSQTLAFTGSLYLVGTSTVTGDGILDVTGGNATIIGAVYAGIADARTVTIAGAIGGLGSLWKQGAGTLELAGANTFGGVILQEGSLVIGANTALGSGTFYIQPTGTTRVGFSADALNVGNAVSFNTPYAQTVMDTGNYTATLSGDISGAGGFAKTGAGALTLSGAVSHTGTTSVLGGTLAGDINSSLAVVIANQSVLAGNLTRATGRTLAVSSGTIAGDLTLGGGSLLFDLRGSNGAAGTHDAFSVTDAFASNSASVIDLSNFGTALQYTIITAGDLTGANLGNFSFTLGGRALTNRASPSLAVSGNDIVLTPAVRSLMMRWAGGDAGAPLLWDTQVANWSEPASALPAEIIFRAGDFVVFNPAASGTVNVAAAGVVTSDITVNVADAASVHTFTGGMIATRASSSDIAGATGYVFVDTSIDASGSIASQGKLVKAGAGTLTFANAGNDFTGGLDIDAGIVSFNNASQLVTTGTAITFTGSGTLRVDADILGASGTLASAIAVAVSAAGVIDTQGHTLEYTGAITSGNTVSALAKTGPGSLILRATDNSGYAGAFNVSAGKLLLADSAKLGGAITIANGALAGGNGSFAGNVTVGDGGVLRAGTGDAGESGGAGVLFIGGNLTLTGGARVNFRIFGPGSNDTLNVGGVISADTNTNIVSLHYGSLASGTYFLGQAAGLAGIKNILINDVAVNTALRARYDLAATGGTLFLYYGMDDSRYMQWTGASGTFNWNPALSNWVGYNGDISGEQNFQDGDTVRFATSGNTTVAIDSTAYVSDLVVDNTGTLAFTGEAITMDASLITGTFIGNPESKLVKAGAGALVLDNVANNFTGGIDLSGGVLAFSNTAQINTSGAAVNLTGSGTLRANAAMEIAHTINLAPGAAGALDTGANTVTFGGALTGSGTLVKLGGGGLAYSGATSGTGLLAAAATTRIDAGYVALRDFAAADIPALNHAFIINGGWLDLSDATGFDPDDSAGANDWTGLTITGSLGGVIGGNDKITLRAGDALGGIGAAGSGAGLFVVVDAGVAGFATMTGSNGYAGATVLRSGTLRVSSDSQLGLASLNREIRFEGAGANLEITTDGYSSTREIELRADGGIGVVASATVTWGGVITGSSRVFSKTGAGTLVLTGSNDAALTFAVAEGTLQGNTRSLRNDIATAAAGAVVFAQETDGQYTGIISGAGAFEKRGAGILTMTAVSALTGATRIVAGTLKVGSDNILGANSAHSISTGAILDMRGTRQSVAGLDNNGSILLTADVNSRLGLVNRSDLLAVAGDITGGGTLNLRLIDVAPTVTAGSGQAILISGLGNTSDFDIVIDGGHITDVYGWAVEKIENDYVLTRSPLSPLIPGVVGIDAAVLVSTQAAFDALGQRLGSMRLASGNAARQGFDVWLNGIYRRDEISEPLYDGARTNTQGVQAGFDYTGESKRYAAGLFADYMNTDMDMPGGRTRTGVTGCGAYLTMRPAPAWYVDVLLRAHTSTHTVSLPGVADFDMDANGFGVSAMYGYEIKTRSGWNVEPQVQLTWHRTSVDETLDPGFRLFKVNTIASFRARVGGQISKQIALKNGVRVSPYVRASFVRELEGRNNVIVMQYTDETRRYLRNRYDFDDNFGGGSGILSVGVTLRIRDRFDAWADASSHFGGKMESHGINLGVAWHW